MHLCGGIRYIIKEKFNFSNRIWDTSIISKPKNKLSKEIKFISKEGAAVYKFLDLTREIPEGKNVPYI